MISLLVNDLPGITPNRGITEAAVSLAIIKKKGGDRAFNFGKVSRAVYILPKRV
jgi:hypothetical protein